MCERLFGVRKCVDNNSSSINTIYKINSNLIKMNSNLIKMCERLFGVRKCVEVFSKFENE